MQETFGETLVDFVIEYEGRRNNHQESRNATFSAILAYKFWNIFNGESNMACHVRPNHKSRIPDLLTNGFISGQNKKNADRTRRFVLKFIPHGLSA